MHFLIYDTAILEGSGLIMHVMRENSASLHTDDAIRQNASSYVIIQKDC